MTDYTKLIEDLRGEKDFYHNHATLSMILCAADAIEALQADVARLNANAQILQEMHEADSAENVRLLYEVDAISGIKAERDALQAKLDAIQKQEPVAPEQIEAAWRAGWAACRDAEYVGQEAENEAWGMSQTCESADWENASPKAQEPVCNLPERDTSNPAEAQGLFRKFIVQRVDGSHQLGGKHYGCEYFVLDVDHDPHATAALQAYAVACAKSHPQLSADLIAKHGAAPKALEPLTDGQIESLVDVAYKHWQDKTTFDIGKVRSDFRSVPGIGSQQ